MSLDLAFRLGGATVLAFIGVWSGREFLTRLNLPTDPRYILALALFSAAIGLSVTPWLTIRPFNWFRTRIRQVPLQSLVTGATGLAIGLILGALLSLPLSLLPAPFGRVLPIVVTAVVAILTMTTLVLRQKDFLNILPNHWIKEATDGRRNDYLLLDTSVIIDGRVADITRTGFIKGTMLVPRFVLDELQHIADSPDTLRRNRGRRGLDILNKLQKESDVPVQITDMDVADIREVDGKLIRLARTLRCPVVTNDYNLNRVAELQGVHVLNINELANAVKAVLLPGESIRVQVIQEGKEAGQGVAYLDDGTMVVVESGKRYIDKTLDVVVTRVLQTVAGRMIFAQPAEKSGRS